jgi:hypothetical protein
MTKLIVTLTLLTLTTCALMGASPAHASTEPIGASTVGIGTGASSVCLSTYGGTRPGTPVQVAKCNPDLPREQWLFANGTLSPWGKPSSVVTVSSRGFLVLAKRAASFTTWTYGPAHELTTPTLAGTAWLTWLPGSGRVPWVSTAQGAGQTVYVFTKAG